MSHRLAVPSVVVSGLVASIAAVAVQLAAPSNAFADQLQPPMAQPTAVQLPVVQSLGVQSPGVQSHTVETSEVQAPAVKHPLRIGLALGGGGARGSAHVGVLRVLEREGIHVDMIAGTSIGAIVGGMYCAGLPIDVIEAQFTTPKLMKSYMTAPIYLSVAARPIFLLPRLVGWRPYDGFYFGNKFRNYYKRLLPEDRQDIENLKIPFHAMTTNLVDGQSFVIADGDLARAVQASSAIPVLRRPVGIGDDHVLVDGALIVNVPVDEVRAMGADVVIAVSVSERVEILPGKHFRKVGSVGRRLEQVFLSHTDATQMAHADLIIHPRTDKIGILSTDPKDAIRGVKAGEDAAMEALPAIRQKIEALKSASAN